MLNVNTHSRTDLAGIILSMACLVHCVVLTIAVLLGSVGGALSLSSDFVHQLMLLVVVPVSGLALYGGWVRHRRRDVMLLGALGIGLLAFAAFFAHDHLGHATDTGITVVGSAMLALSHWKNRACGCTGQTKAVA